MAKSLSTTLPSRVLPSVCALYAALALCLAPGSSAHAELDKESLEALEKTQQLLRDAGQRKSAIEQSPDAQRNHDSLEKLVGSQNAGAAYDISADILDKLVKESNGDVVVMQQKLQEAQKNPEAFAKKYLSPEHLARINSMANQAGGGGGSVNKKP